MSIGRIYKIVADETEKIYIGSTTSTLKKRFIHHKCMYQTKNKRGTTSRYIFDFPNPRIELLEEIVFENKIDLEKKEREHIESNINCVNVIIPSRTKKEYVDKYLINYYHETHHCECGGHYSIKHKMRHIRKSAIHKKYLENH